MTQPRNGMKHEEMVPYLSGGGDGGENTIDAEADVL